MSETITASQYRSQQVKNMRKKDHTTVELWFPKEDIEIIDKMALEDNRKRKSFLENEIKKLIKTYKPKSK